MEDSRTLRQYKGLDAWESNNYRGTLEWITGMGKTYASIMAIEGMIRKQNIKSVIIIVPTIDLKNQWEEELKKNNINITKVIVVNTAAKYYDSLECDLLIIDEYHTVAGEYFRSVLKIPYKFILTLTATIERTDGLHELLLKHSPIVDTITLEEALDNNWISEFIVYNIAVELSKKEMSLYRKYNTAFKKLACKISGINEANYFLKSKDTNKVRMAGRYYKYLRLRKDICKNNSNKIDIVRRLINCFDSEYGIIFNPSIKFAKEVEKTLGSKTCLSYHSKLSKKDRALIIGSFKSNLNPVRFLSTVSALDAGFDHPKSSIGIITSGNSSQLRNIQRTGRVVRKHPNKQAIIINLYSPGTQEVSWLHSRLKDAKVIDISIDNFEQKYKKPKR